MDFVYRLKTKYKVTAGGVEIGFTDSGKKVYDTFDHPSHASFSFNDHTDAMLIHSYLYYVKNREDSKEQGKKHEEATRNARGKIMKTFDNKWNPEQGKSKTNRDYR